MKKNNTLPISQSTGRNESKCIILSIKLTKNVWDRKIFGKGTKIYTTICGFDIFFTTFAKN